VPDRPRERGGAPGQAGTLTYLHGDHLGSTSLATDADGDELYRRGYYPFGEERYAVGVAVTDYGFTGQREEAYVDLIEMGARWYDSSLGRWISADTIVPDPANPQSLNRYSYVYNNPVIYVDPTGHSPWYTIDGQPVSYWLDGPTSGPETPDETVQGPKETRCSTLGEGSLVESVFVGDAPWRPVGQGDPSDPTLGGAWGLVTFLLEESVRYAGRSAFERWAKTQDPNVTLELFYSREDEGLYLYGIAIDNRSQETIEISWALVEANTVVATGGPSWVRPRQSNELIPVWSIGQSIARPVASRYVEVAVNVDVYTVLVNYPMHRGVEFDVVVARDAG
jgi:RHS repeat-associated protein